jgi:hypothetical protein
VEVRNTFQTLGEQQEMTRQLQSGPLGSKNKVLGFRRKTKEEWIKQETWKKIEEKVNQTEDQQHQIRVLIKTAQKNIHRTEQRGQENGKS